VRLDHLLSKEHFTASLAGVVQSRAHTMIWCPSAGAGRSVWGGARGWNADQFGRQLLLLLVRRHLGGAGNGVVGVGRFVGTLLGPERAGPRGTGGIVCLGRACLHLVPPPSLRGSSVGLAGSCGGCLVVR
jgi:hypothetical protein